MIAALIQLVITDKRGQIVVWIAIRIDCTDHRGGIGADLSSGAYFIPDAHFIDAASQGAIGGATTSPADEYI